MYDAENRSIMNIDENKFLVFERKMFGVVKDDTETSECATKKSKELESLYQKPTKRIYTGKRVRQIEMVVQQKPIYYYVPNRKKILLYRLAEYYCIKIMSVKTSIMILNKNRFVRRQEKCNIRVSNRSIGA